MNNSEEVRRRLKKASRIVAFTGAGISAESGVPTFRGSDGLWRQFRAEDLATPEAFVRNPTLVWEWYNWRRGLIAQVAPNAGHYAVTELERHTRQFVLVTQNVDGLHNRAGTKNVLKLHGDIWTLRCSRCGDEKRNIDVPLQPLPPRCERCGGIERPGVVWFGEPLPATIWHQAEEAVRQCDVFLAIGTSALVWPAAGLPRVAKSHGAFLVEINVEPTTLADAVDITLQGKAGEVLPQLL